MRKILSAVFSSLAAILALGSLTAASPARLPKCSGRVVWTVPTQKVYVLSNNPRYAKKPGAYVCESTAIARGYRLRPLQVARPAVHPAAPGTPRPRPTASAARVGGTTPENSTLTAIARAQIDIIRTGKIDRTQYSPAMNGVLTDKVITQWSQLLALSGAVTSFTYAGTSLVSGLPVTQYAVSFERPISAPNLPTTNRWVESIATDPAGKVVYLSFAPQS